MNVRLGCFTLSFFEALLALGTPRAYAVELVADATWSLYELWASIASWTDRFRVGASSALAFASIGSDGGSVSLRFPFSAPGYVIELVRA